MLKTQQKIKKDFHFSGIMNLRKTKTPRKENPKMMISQKSKKEKNKNLKAKFTNETISNNVNASYLESFMKKIGLKYILTKEISYIKRHNAIHNTTNIIDYMISAVILGYNKFLHMNDLRNDKVFKSIKGYELPDEKVCRDLLSIMPSVTVEELRRVNKALLHLKAETENTHRFIDIDCDDTVCTVFGGQEGSAVGYNPKYHGRGSYKEKFGIITDSSELLNATLESGKNHSNKNFLEFLKETVNNLPNKWIMRRLRVDKGFFDEATFKYCEENTYEYIAKAAVRSGLKSIIELVVSNPGEYEWRRINSIYSVTEITAALPSWEKARRFIIVRKDIKAKETKQLKLFKDAEYTYQAIVTNIDYMTPEEIFDDYNVRCNMENKIDELKEGYSFDKNSQQDKKCNELFLLIKMIAYNIQNWFKTAILPVELKNKEISTLRRIFYKVSGNISGTGRYRHINFAPNILLSRIIPLINNALNTFKVITT